MDFNSIIDKRISSSALKESKKSTRDLVWYYQKPKTSASHFDFGNAMELYLIDQDEFDLKVAVFDDREFLLELANDRPELRSPKRSKEYATFKRNFEEENSDKYIIGATGSESLEIIKTLYRLAQAHPFTKKLKGNYQDPFEWICPLTGLKRYARTDIFNESERYIIDIKTDGGSPGGFERSAVNNDYYLQAYDQIQGAIHSGKMKSVEKYYWYVLTKKEPYFIDVYCLDPERLLKVEEVYNSTLLRVAEDLNSGENIVWHQHPIKLISPPGYYK